jgi:hypothetical protein
MSTATIDTPPSVNQTPMTVPANPGTSSAAIAKLFPTESAPVVETPKTEVTPAPETKVEPPVKEEAKSFLKSVTNAPETAPAVKEAQVVEKPKSKTALEIENMKSEYTEKVKAAELQRDEMKAKAFDLENELVSLREKASSLADYEEIKQKNKEFQEVITRLDIQELPEFKQKYTIQETELYTRLGEVLDGTENKEKIIATLKMAPSAERDAKLDELQEGLGLTKISKVANYAARLDELQSNKKLEIDNAAIAQRIYQERQAEREGQKKAQAATIFDKYAKHFSETDPTYKKRDGDEAFNQNVDQRLIQARELYFQGTDEQRAQAMLAAVDRPILMQLVKTLSDELQTAQKALNGKLESTPGVGATRKDEPAKPQTFLESLKQTVSG